jgi:hypothetical protein
MPKIERWDNLPAAVRQHLADRMRERAISIADLNQLLYGLTQAGGAGSDWYKDSGSFKICSHGSFKERSCFAGKQPRGEAV